jgi:peptidoglycan/xylan/chitin deacetylase (PgdA/CDA1 family)
MYDTQQWLPPKTVLITIDDGYDDVYDYAFPIAKKYNIVLNLMIPTGLLGKPNYMTWDELKELSQSELVHIYNHTNSHAELTKLNREEKTREVREAKEQLANQLGNHTTVFSYPYCSIDEEAIDVVKQQGYVAGFSTKGGTEQCTSFIMTLHRTHIGNSNLDGYGF